MRSRTLHTVDPDDHEQVRRNRRHITMNRDGFIPHGQDPFDGHHDSTQIGARDVDGRIALGDWRGYRREKGYDAVALVDWGDGGIEEERVGGLLAVDAVFDLGPCALPDYHRGSCEAGDPQ